jgi:phage baseplate assembly protein W
MTTTDLAGRSFLGAGWRFPIRIDGRGGLGWSSGEQDIAEAIWLILSTAKGERQMRPRFGCGIHDEVFAGINAATQAAISYQVRAALTEWEPRIDVLDVGVEAGDRSGTSLLLLVKVSYRIRANNQMHNLVYPFYAQEGATEGGEA